MSAAGAALREIAPRFPAREDCFFYHAMTLPEGEVDGIWDLRAQTHPYLGEVGLAGRSVLEVGPASGFLSFWMEAAGANVTCLEPTLEHLWDVVPFEGFDTPRWRQTFLGEIQGVRNSFWYAHHALGSKVRMIEADPYRISEAAGRFDVGVLAAVLLHCRNPFDLLQSVASHVSGAMVVTEEYNEALGPAAACMFQPHLGVQQVDTWWQFTPQFFVSALGLLGFPRARVLLHTQQQPGHQREVRMFTVVCERT